MTDQAVTSYLGYPLTITEQTVTVTTPHGRIRATSVKQARLIVRGYRKEERAAV